MYYLFIVYLKRSATSREASNDTLLSVGVLSLVYTRPTSLGLPKGLSFSFSIVYLLPLLILWRMK